MISEHYEALTRTEQAIYDKSSNSAPRRKYETIGKLRYDLSEAIQHVKALSYPQNDPHDVAAAKEFLKRHP